MKHETPLSLVCTAVYVNRLGYYFDKTPEKLFTRAEIYALVLESFQEAFLGLIKDKKPILDVDINYCSEILTAGRKWHKSGGRTHYDSSQAKMEARKLHYIAIEIALSKNINPRTLQQKLFDNT